jgi:hypothetical protein
LGHHTKKGVKMARQLTEAHAHPLTAGKTLAISAASFSPAFRQLLKNVVSVLAPLSSPLQPMILIQIRRFHPFWFLERHF